MPDPPFKGCPAPDAGVTGRQPWIPRSGEVRAPVRDSGAPGGPPARPVPPGWVRTAGS